MIGQMNQLEEYQLAYMHRQFQLKVINEIYKDP